MTSESYPDLHASFGPGSIAAQAPVDAARSVDMTSTQGRAFDPATAILMAADTPGRGVVRSGVMSIDHNGMLHAIPFHALRMFDAAARHRNMVRAATELNLTQGAVIACRMVLGIGEAFCYPVNAKVTSLWFRRFERGLATGIWVSGSRVGSAITLRSSPSS